MIALLSAALVFPGGDMGDLARTVALWSHRPTVALVQARREWSRGPTGTGFSNQYPVAAAKVPSFEMEATSADDPKDLERLLRVKAHVEGSAKAGALALWNGIWEDETTLPRNVRMPLPLGWKEAAPSALEVGSGKATFNLDDDQAVRVETLARLPWTKPVRVHWLLNMMWVVPVAKAGEEKQVLGALALAISGKLVDTQEGYRIDLDPQAFRTRAQASVVARAPAYPRGSLGEAGLDIAIETWKWIDDAALQSLYGERNHAEILKVEKGTRLEVALSRYYALYKQRAETGIPGPSNGVSGMRELLAKVDTSKAPRILISQNLGTGGGWYQIGGGTVMF